MVLYNNSSNNYSTARFMVSQTAGQGNFLTIQSAVDAASSGDVIFLMPGVYTENVILKSGVNFTCFTASGEYGHYNVSINGKFSDNGVSLNSSFSDIQLQTNGDYCLQLTGSASSIQFVDCNILANGNTALSMSSGNQNIYLYQCIGNVLTSGISFFSITSGDIWIYDCQLDNYGGTTTGTSFSGGAMTMYSSQIGFPLVISGTAGATVDNCTIDCSSLNVPCITVSDTAGANIRYCYLQSGSASGIVMGGSTNVHSSYNTLSSSNQYLIASA